MQANETAEQEGKESQDEDVAQLADLPTRVSDVPGTPDQPRREAGAGNFTDNLVRLLGMHALSQHLAAQLVGVSNTTMSAWMTGKSTPSLSKAVAVAELFEVSAERLISAPFADLLSRELADPERFARVEERLRSSQRPVSNR